MAKRRTFIGKEETGYGDPLSDCTDFNIIQFINDNDTPIDSPADPAFLRAGNYQAQQQHQLLTGAPSNHNTALHCNTANSSNGHQHNGWAGAYQASGHNGGMFSTNQSLPDSPPITDISGNGSSGSPSTNSEPPYSPDQYPYAAIHQNRNMILSMQNMHGLDSQILLPPELQPMLRGGIITHQTQHSPQSEFLSPYPPQTPGSHTSQVSPPAVDPRCPSNYMLPQQNYSVDMYGNILEPMSDQNGCNPLNIDPPGNKRKRTESGIPIVKNEPSPRIYGGGLPQPLQMQNRPMSVSLDEYDENFHCQKAIKFAPFNENVWRQLYTVNQRPVNLKVDVVADKGFNYSASDGCFVNQKKNHFQITVHIETQDELPPKLIKIDDKLKQVKEFKLAFCGVKAEMTNSEIQIRQSQTDRKPIPHEPVHLEILERRVTKVTVPRLHFSETTMNNHRKNGKPNPEQKYFLLVVQLIATTDDGQYIVKAYQSDKVIVRASNPGQFEPPENESEKWIKTGNTLHYPGQVVVGGDRALSDNSLTVHGNIAMTGQITRPSDRRLKEDIEPVPTNEALSRVSQLRVVEYNYKPEVAQQWSMDNRHRVGLIAQELAEVIPDAVRENGEFLTIDDSRVFYDTVAAAQELYRLTGNLENKIDEVEQISKKLAKFSKKKQQFGSTISGLSGLTQWMNGDDGKSLSYSRTSLASSTPSCDSDATHRRGRRDSKNAKACRHYCQHNSVPLCSSKVTQGTIIALVIVMALCLVTMCSLYVLDWYNRTYNAVPPHPHYYIPSSKSNITCDGYENGFGCIIANLPPGVKNSWLPKAQPKAPILAPFCGPKSDCPIFCCAENHQYNFESGRQNDDSVSIVALPKGPKSPIELRTNPGQQPSITSGFSIEVVNLNVTLDERFCVEGSCIPRSGYYNYFVPVSAYMPTIPLHLRFNIPDGKFVDSCGSLRDFEHKTCQVNYDDKNVVDTDAFKVPKSYRLSEETFELTVGGFMQSAYQFRVGYSTESCNMSEDQQGRSFDEYNIVFYRKCSPNSTL